MPAVKNVRDHMCKGLFQWSVESQEQCKPSIDENGVIGGCDGDNRLTISHCPFCGTYLGESERFVEDWEKCYQCQTPEVDGLCPKCD